MFLTHSTSDDSQTPHIELLADGVYLLHQAANSAALQLDVAAVAGQAPFRHMQVVGGKAMSAAMTNCGPLGWTSSPQGYSYSALDPLSSLPWPALPSSFALLAQRCAAAAGYNGFQPDACLINRYDGSAHMGLHQDRDERDLSQPIVSVTLGASAVFLLGGLQRQGTVQSLLLTDGDVLVWGGAARLRFHGVRAPQANASGQAPLRINLTLRKAG